MKIRVQYHGQLRTLAGAADADSAAGEQVSEGTHLSALLRSAADRAGGEFAAIVFGDSGAIRPSVRVIINDAVVPSGEDPTLRDGDEVLVFSAISGG